MTAPTFVRAIDGDVRPLLVDAFRRADDVPLGAAPNLRQVAFERIVPLDPMVAVVAEAMRRFESTPSRSDAWLAPRLHATLRLTRREATDQGMWAWLNVVALPGYVRWRWPPKDDETPIPFDRFIGDDSTGGLTRLWWAAEIARNGSDYAVVERALSIRRFDLWQRLVFMHHKACALAAVDFLSTFGGRGVTHSQSLAMVKAMNVAVRTTLLDALAPSPSIDAHAVRAWVKVEADETLMMDRLPVGPDEAPVPETSIAQARAFVSEIADRIQLANVKSRGSDAEDKDAE